MSEVLKSCPFCGAYCSWERDSRWQAFGGGQVLYINCGRCGGEGPGRYEKQDAITAWNTRVPQEEGGP